MSLLNSNPLAPQQWHGVLPVSNRYTFGIAGERFFREIKNGRIFGSHCPKCDLIHVPATAFCERCLSELNEWLDVGTEGIINSFTILHINYDGSPKESPEVVAFIGIANGGIIHRLCEIAPGDLRIGMTVKAKFKPVRERIGSIEDILFFKPV